jgi:hypothetical protein
MSTPSKETIRDVLEELEDLDLPDGAYWAMAHERLGLEYGDVFSMIAEDPDFYGYKDAAS